MKQILGLLLACLAFSACAVDTSPKNGAQKCSENTNRQCASGFHCDEGFCWKDGTGPGAKSESDAAVIVEDAAGRTTDVLSGNGGAGGLSGNLLPIEFSPTDGSTGVDPTAPISVRFNESIDATSATNDRLYLSGRSGIVPGTLEVLNDRIVFHPTNSLVPLANYNLSLKQGIRSSTGIVSTADQSLKFQTRPGVWQPTRTAAASSAIPGSTAAYSNLAVNRSGAGIFARLLLADGTMKVLVQRFASKTGWAPESEIASLAVAPDPNSAPTRVSVSCVLFDDGTEIFFWNSPTSGAVTARSCKPGVACTDRTFTQSSFASFSVGYSANGHVGLFLNDDAQSPKRALYARDDMGTWNEIPTGGLSQNLSVSSVTDAGAILLMDPASYAFIRIGADGTRKDIEILSKMASDKSNVRVVSDDLGYFVALWNDAKDTLSTNLAPTAGSWALPQVVAADTRYSAIARGFSGSVVAALGSPQKSLLVSRFARDKGWSVPEVVFNPTQSVEYSLYPIKLDIFAGDPVSGETIVTFVSRPQLGITLAAFHGTSLDGWAPPILINPTSETGLVGLAFFWGGVSMDGNVHVIWRSGTSQQSALWGRDFERR